MGLATQQRLLRELVYVWKRSGIQVFLYYVQSALMPADPISRVREHWGGNKAKSLANVTKIFGEVRAQPCLFLYGRLGGFRIKVDGGVVGEGPHAVVRV